eukprot:evm.model.scf_318.1 EVM.evm.TU.scf_318.1   scf_318:494-3079(+)
MASALRLCAQASASKVLGREASACDAPARALSATRGLFAGAALARRSALAGATLWWTGGEGWAQARSLTKVRMGTELAPTEAPEGLELATFAGGCFWGLELAFQRAPGVVTTSVGYTQGTLPNPSYEAVCSGRTGHCEAVQVAFDPSATTYKELLNVFYGQTDPTQLNQQGNDVGPQYRSGIYYHSDQQKADALASLAEVQAALDAGTFRRVRGKKVVVEVEPAGDYYVAEGYHQQYLSRGGRFAMPQSAEKGCTEKIRCYG